MQEIEHIKKLLGTYAPKEIYQTGNLDLINQTKIAIVGSRRASQYAKTQTYLLAKAVRDGGGVVVSGGAMGIDAAAHEGAFPSTIAVLANGIDIDYPKTNKDLLAKIRKSSLVISEYPSGTQPVNYGFVARNRIVVGISEAVVIAEAEEDSGSMRSYEWAKKMNKPIYVLPHRINESSGTQKLLAGANAQAIYDFNDFLTKFNLGINSKKDDLIDFCKMNPSYDDVFAKFGDKLFEYELDGKITILNGLVSPK